MNYPIDIVYLWVDAADEKWRAEKDKWMRRIAGNGHIDAVHDARFRDNGELLHSMRSVAQNVPWVNHIYIVTGFGQVPKWLNTKHPKITIVPHEQIMPADALPTFNSDAIEMCIANIPGLAEHFLLMNDDMFFNRPLTSRYFFDAAGRPIVRHSRTKTTPNNLGAGDSLYTHNLVHSAWMIERIFGPRLYHLRPSHGIDPYLKSSYLECIKHPDIAPTVNRTVHNKFRSDHQTQRWIFNLYDFITGRAVMLHSRARKSGRHKILNFIYNTLHFRAVRTSPIYSSDVMTSYHALMRAPIFCINDAVSVSDDTRRANAQFLKVRWPDKCEFEK